MVNKKIRIKWGTYGDGSPADYSDDPIYLFLKDNYEIEFCDDPDYLICDIASHDDLKYDCIKIISTIENVVPDFSRYDYVMGFDYITFGDRYQRVPLFSSYKSYDILNKPRIFAEEDIIALLNRKFCSFVVSNPGADPIREKFFHELSKYKKVDSGGRFLNNIGGPVKDKLNFCANYKFNIAIENSASPGYTTEKIMEPLAVNSVPIYYGDPLITNDFQENCMVRIKSEDDIQRAIEEVIYLDNNDDAYIERCLAPRLVNDWDYYNKQREIFLRKIFDQPLEKAKRTVPYGFQRHYRRKLLQFYRLDDIIKWPFRKIYALKWK